MRFDCVRLPSSWDEVMPLVSQCAGADWQGRFVLGLETLIAVLIISAVLAAAIVKVRPRNG